MLNGNVQSLIACAALALAVACLLVACAPATAPTATPAGAAGASPTTAATPATPPPGATATPTAASAGTPDTAGSGTPAAFACVLRPAMTEGPYFVDGQPERADVRSDTTTGGEIRPGVPLALTFTVASQAGGSCTPLAGARVDIWHADALGVYSGVAGRGGNAMRGWQTTDADGVARFTTVYPGWYGGRTPHIHFKIRVPIATGETYDYTAQLFFDEAVTAEVYAQAPYNTRGAQDTTNARDGIFRSAGAELLLAPDGAPGLRLTPANGGYAAAFGVALNLSQARVTDWGRAFGW